MYERRVSLMFYCLFLARRTVFEKNEKESLEEIVKILFEILEIWTWLDQFLSEKAKEKCVIFYFECWKVLFFFNYNVLHRNKVVGYGNSKHCLFIDDLTSIEIRVLNNFILPITDYVLILGQSKLRRIKHACDIAGVD